MATQLYKLTLKRGYPQDTHHRAGLVLARGGALVTELSKDQLEAVKNDAYIELSKAEPGEQSQAAPAPEDEGAGVASNAHVGPDAPDRTASEGAEADEDQPTGDEEAAGSDAAGEAAAGGVTPTEPVSGEPGSEAGTGAGADTVEGAVPTEPVSGEAGSEPTREGEESADQAPAADEAEEVTVDTLVRDHSREELNGIAVKEGVSNAAELDNKQQVATAILKVRAAAGN